MWRGDCGEAVEEGKRLCGEGTVERWMRGRGCGEREVGRGDCGEVDEGKRLCGEGTVERWMRGRGCGEREVGRGDCGEVDEGKTETMGRGDCGEVDERKRLWGEGTVETEVDEGKRLWGKGCGEVDEGTATRRSVDFPTLTLAALILANAGLTDYFSLSDN